MSDILRSNDVYVFLGSGFPNNSKLLIASLSKNKITSALGSCRIFGGELGDPIENMLLQGFNMCVNWS